MYKTTDEDTGEEIYLPLLHTTGSKRNADTISKPSQTNRLKLKIHTNDDVKILWNITSDIDLTKDFCSCVIDCEVVKYDPMENAITTTPDDTILLIRYCIDLH